MDVLIALKNKQELAIDAVGRDETKPTIGYASLLIIPLHDELSLVQSDAC